jgi:hypothetical protein
MTDLSRDARRIIELGRGGQDPTAAQRQRVRTGVAAGVAAIGVTTAGAGAATAATATSTAAGTGSVLGIKLAIVTAVAVGAGTVGGVVAVRSSRGPAPAPVSEPAREAPVVEEASPIAVPRLAPRLQAAEEAPKPQKNRRQATGDRQQATGDDIAPATESGSESQSASDAEPQPEEETAARPVAKGMDEGTLLAIAVDANRRKDYPSVLAATAIHAARFPRSRHALDRDTLRAIALCQTGRQEEGRWVLGPARRWLSMPPGRVNDILAACALAGHDGDEP